jgi:hypothetical protein
MEESEEFIVNMALSMYVGEACSYCLKVYTEDDARNAGIVWAYDKHKDPPLVAGQAMMLACKECWETNNAQ